MFTEINQELLAKAGSDAIKAWYSSVQAKAPKGFVFTGEFRPPKKGEPFLSRMYGYELATAECDLSEPRLILAPAQIGWKITLLGRGPKAGEDYIMRVRRHDTCMPAVLIWHQATPGEYVLYEAVSVEPMFALDTQHECVLL